MRARRQDDRPSQSAFRGDVDALATRVDELAAIVREASGSVVAVRGEVARTERRLKDDASRVGDALTRVQDELAALRKRPAPTASAPTGGSQAEELAVLVERVKTLSGMVGENAGRLAAREGGLTELRSALTDEGARVDEALADVRRDIAALATRVAATAVRPAAAPPDERLHGKITALDDRIDGLASTVRETAGSVVATSGKLARTGEQVAALETTLETRSRETRAAITMLERELSSLRERAGADPRAQEGSRRLADAVQALGDRLDTVSGIVRESAGRLAAREEISIDLDRRLTRLAENVDALTEEVRRERDAVAPTASIAGEGVTAAELATRLAPFAVALERLTGRADELSVEATQVDTALHEALVNRVEGLEREHGRLRSEIAQTVTELTTSHETLARDLETVSAVAREALERPVPDPAPVLHELAAKLERIEIDRRIVAEQLADVESAWRDEREALQARLEEITTSAEGAPPGEDAERLVHELTVRLDRLERDRESVSDIGSLAEGWTNSLGVLAARVDYGLIRLQQVTEAPAGPAEAQELVDLAARVASMESDRDSVLGELTRATESWANERAALHERVAELAARIVTGPLDLPTTTGTVAVDLGDASVELDRLRIGLEGMRMRLAYHEKTVAELGGGTLATRLDELTARLDRLQHAVVAGGGGGAPLAGGEPLLGLDVDGLMRRVEHAERSALNQRKDMLGQLEKIAARMDWRLQRLESTSESRIIA